ncbi:hypothetical protein GCM10009086_25200 [Pseudomonas rhodesiae]
MIRADRHGQVFTGVLGQSCLVNGQGCDPFGKHDRHVGVCQHQTHTAVFKHVGQTLARVTRVEGHVGPARLEHCQQADHHGEGALNGNPDQHLRPDAVGHQAMGQAIGLQVQLGIAQRYAIEHQRYRLWALPCLRLEQTLHPARPRRGRCTGVPGLRKTLTLTGTQHRQVCKVFVRACNHGPQYA